jgi:HEAT repeat protein
VKPFIHTFLLASLISTNLAACCDERALPTAIRNLYSDKASDRNKALLLIARCGDRAETSVPRIAQLMYDENVGVASSAAYALRSIDTKAARSALKAAEQARAARRAQR